MENQNNAAQPMLTDEEIQDIADGFDIYGAKPEFARAIESALLSKLRAPVVEITIGVAATEQGATICLMQPHVDGTATVIYSETHPIGDSLGRAALASAPVACDHQFHFFGDQKERRCNRCGVIESKASAPVAGEAQRLDAPAQVGGTRFGKGIHWSTVIHAAQRHHEYMQDPAREAARIAQAKQFQELVAGDAAPQASEAVRDGKWPMLSELHLHALMFAYNEGYSKAYDGRVFPNPFSENGSQAAAWQLGTDDGTEARAALSAQPGAQTKGNEE